MNRVMKICFCIQIGCLFIMISNVAWTSFDFFLSRKIGVNLVIQSACLFFAIGLGFGLLIFKPWKPAKDGGA